MMDEIKYKIKLRDLENAITKRMNVLKKLLPQYSGTIATIELLAKGKNIGQEETPKMENIDRVLDAFTQEELVAIHFLLISNGKKLNNSKLHSTIIDAIEIRIITLTQHALKGNPAVNPIVVIYSYMTKELRRKIREIEKMHIIKIWEYARIAKKIDDDITQIIIDILNI